MSVRKSDKAKRLLKSFLAPEKVRFCLCITTAPRHVPECVDFCGQSLLAVCTDYLWQCSFPTCKQGDSLPQTVSMPQWEDITLFNVDSVFGEKEGGTSPDSHGRNSNR